MYVFKCKQIKKYISLHFLIHFSIIFFSKYKYINYIKSINYINIIVIIMRTPYAYIYCTSEYVCMCVASAFLFFMGSISTHPCIISLFQKTSIPRPLIQIHRDKNPFKRFTFSCHASHQS